MGDFLIMVAIPFGLSLLACAAFAYLGYRRGYRRGIADKGGRGVRRGITCRH